MCISQMRVLRCAASPPRGEGRIAQPLHFLHHPRLQQSIVIEPAVNARMLFLDELACEARPRAQDAAAERCDLLIKAERAADIFGTGGGPNRSLNDVGSKHTISGTLMLRAASRVATFNAASAPIEWPIRTGRAPSSAARDAAAKMRGTSP